ncbi:hypothetical protein ACQEU3_45840 [Spirillospora sp. CA-253888]
MNISDKQPDEYMGTVISLEELAALLRPFGMIVTVDPGADRHYQAAQVAHALVGVVEAHASRAEDAYRHVADGTDPHEVHTDLVQTSLMAFAGINCRSAADELALLSWRATRLAGALGALDFPGPPRRPHRVRRRPDPHPAADRRRPVGDGHRRPHRRRPPPRPRPGRRRRSGPGQGHESPAGRRRRRPAHRRRQPDDHHRLTTTDRPRRTRPAPGPSRTHRDGPAACGGMTRQARAPGHGRPRVPPAGAPAPSIFRRAPGPIKTHPSNASPDGPATRPTGRAPPQMPHSGA